MELRIEKRIGALLILAAAMAHGASFPARHRHLHGSKPGTLTVTETGIVFEEQEKKPSHSRSWKYDDIQELTLSPGGLRILTYEDQKWKLGLDREYQFDGLPKDFTAQIYPLFRRLDQRFVAAIADEPQTILWSGGAKLTHGNLGAQGTLTIGADRIVFDSPKGTSYTWPDSDIVNVAAAGDFDFMLTTLQRDYHFQLKHALPPESYQELWMRLNREKGLAIFTHP